MDAGYVLIYTSVYFGLYLSLEFFFFRFALFSLFLRSLLFRLLLNDVWEKDAKIKSTEYIRKLENIRVAHAFLITLAY